MSTVTNLDTLKINYLTQEQYDDALENGDIEENEIYMTPADYDVDSIVSKNITNTGDVTIGGNLNVAGTINSSNSPNYPRFISLYSGATFANNAAETWAYTGMSVTVPSGHYYLLQIYALWNNGKPTGVGLHTSTSLTSPYSYGAPVMNQTCAISGASAGIGTFLVNPGTWYIFEKQATASTNNNTYYVRGIDFPVWKEVL